MQNHEQLGPGVRITSEGKLVQQADFFFRSQDRREEQSLVQIRIRIIQT